MSDFRVAHLSGGKANRFARGFQLRAGIFPGDPAQEGGVGDRRGIGVAAVADAETVEDAENDRSVHGSFPRGCARFIGANVDAGRIAPQTLQVVLFSYSGSEDVNDQVCEVQQDPATFAVSLHAEWFLSGG